MNLRRFELRPIASRRLRAALLLVYVLGLISLWQTRFNGVELIVAVAALTTIFADAWRRCKVAVVPLVFSFKPLASYEIDLQLQEIELVCTRASVYPWLVVLQFSAPHGMSAHGPKRTVVLLRDSLVNSKPDHWRQLLIWSRLARRQLANR